MNWSSKEILGMDGPDDLFSGDVHEMKLEYAKLAKIWHPDRNGNSKESHDVMAKINELYELGIRKKCRFIRVVDKNKKAHEITFLNALDFELGTMYVGDSVVAYILDEAYKDLFLNAERIAGSFRYPNETMRQEMSRFLPRILSTFEMEDGKLGMVLCKTPDFLLLRDVLDYYEGKMPERHAAWILSGLYNITCYLDYAGLTHNNISPDTCFISPKHHGVALLGGWWYAVPEGAPMLGVTEEIFSIMPPKVKDERCGNIQTDLESILLLGRELLGDRNGTRLADMGTVPSAMIDWLRGASPISAAEAYRDWGTALDMSFGARRFIEMDLDAKGLYTKLNNKPTNKRRY